MRPIMKTLSLSMISRFATAAAMIALPAAVGFAQRPMPATETKSGTVVEVKEKGRSRTLVLDLGEGEQEFPLTAKLALEVTAPGDATALQAGRFVQAKGTLENERLYIREVTVIIPRRGQKAGAGRIQKAPAVVGESTDTYLITGAILGTQPNKDYPDHTDIGLKVSGAAPPMLLEPGYTVTVSSSDPTLIPAGAEIDLEGTELRGGKFNPTKAIVKLTEPFGSAEAGAEGAEGAAAKPEGDAADKPAAGEKPATGDTPVTGEKPMPKDAASTDEPADSPFKKGNGDSPFKDAEKAAGDAPADSPFKKPGANDSPFKDAEKAGSPADSPFKDGGAKPGTKPR